MTKTNKQGLRMYFYKRLLDCIETKDINKVAIVCGKRCVIVDEKYEKIAKFLLNRYEKLETIPNYNYYYSLKKIKHLTLYASAPLLSLLIQTGNYNQVLAQTHESVAIEETIPEEEFVLEECNEEDITAKEEPNNESDSVMQAEENEESLYEQYLTEYAHYYHLDSEKVIRLAKMFTKNYTDFATVINIENYNIEEIEAKCMLFVYLLNRDELSISLEDFRITKESLQTEEEIETYTYNHIDDLRLQNNLTYSEYVSKICDLFGVKDKSLVLAVSYSEMDVDDPSNASRTKNNFCGMMNSNFELMTFPTPEAGIISMCGNFKNKYNEYSIENVEELAGHYVKGDKTVSNEETETWIHNVEPFYNEITSNYTMYFPEEEEVQVLSLTK